MKLWSTNPKFPCMLFATATSFNEYSNLLKELYLRNTVEGEFYGEIVKYEESFFDTREWHQMFNLNYSNKHDYEHFKSVKNFNGPYALSPKENDYPVFLTFSGNHKYLTWQPISKLAR